MEMIPKKWLPLGGNPNRSWPRSEETQEENFIEFRDPNSVSLDL
jgi:hypothetical protein